jgi:4-carboxymuconolactone decarboxylase
MRRLAKLSPGELTEHQRELYASIVAGPRGAGRQPFRLVDSDGALVGPFNAMLLQPAVGAALQALGAAIRYQGELPSRARELAILVLAAHWASEFERRSHETAGRLAGLREEELAAIHDAQQPGLADPAERAVVRAAWALVRAGDLDEQEYAEAVAQLGPAGLFELSTLVGYYSTLALQRRVFRADDPAAS